MSPSAERRAAVAYIGLGANLGDPLAQLRAARSMLQQEPGVQELRCSSFYRSTPMGPPDQPDYVNAVMAIKTSLEPAALLATLHRVENAHGRVRTGDQWGPRRLDLDLLLYDDATLSTPTLQIPHPGIAEREFVLIPILEIAPELTLPDGRKLRDLLPKCPRLSAPLIRIEEADG